MRITYRLVGLVVMLVLFSLVGCKPAVDIQETDTAATAAAIETAVESTEDAAAAATAEKIIEEADAYSAQSTTDANATITADAQAAATATAYAEATAAFQATGTQIVVNRSVTATARVFARATSTAETIIQATAAAQPMADIVQKLNTDGFLKSTSGEWMRLDYTFDEVWAKIDWYAWWPTELNTQNFVLRTDASWDSDSDTPNSSGCGIVFRIDEKDNHYMTFLSMTGTAHLGEVKYDRWHTIQITDVPGLTFPKGSAEITLAVEDEWVTMLVNGEKVLRDFSLAKRAGDLALTVISGTNKGYGTSCKMENIDIWLLK